MRKEAVHSKWLPPLSLCPHFRKDFTLKSGLYPLICSGWRIIIYKAQKIMNQDFTVKKKQYLSERKIRAEGFTRKKNSSTSNEQKKKEKTCKLEIPPLPYHFANDPSPNVIC